MGLLIDTKAISTILGQLFYDVFWVLVEKNDEIVSPKIRIIH